MERLCARIEKKVHDFFYSVGLFIADHPKRCLTFLSLWTVFMGVGVVRFNEVNNVRDHFSATTSPSRREYAIAREFYEELGSPFHVVVALRAADHGNILRPGHIEKALEIEDFLQYKLKVDHDNSTFSYSDFCGTQCETSDSVNIFLTMFRDSQVRKQTHVKLTYPTMDVFGHRVYLANNIFLVNINNRSNMIEGCGLIAINFHAIYNNTSTEEMMKKWERAVYEYSLKTENDPLIRIYVTSEGLVSEEVRRTGIQAMPLMSLSFVVMIMFTVTTTLKRNPVEAKPVEAVIGVFCPMLSIVASFGMLFWFGFDFLPIVTVVPFLVLAIGVDDVYIFMHAWHRSDHSLACRERMATALADAGPSISITSLTNLLSFAIGVTTTTPAIYTFCVYISVAVIYDYIYQIFFFSAVLVLSGHREAKNINGYCWWKTVPEKKALKGDSSVEDQLDRFSAFAAHFLDLYVDFLMTWWSKLLIGAIMIVYWAVMINGAMQIKVGLTSEKLFMDDSPLLELVRLQSNVIFKEGGQVAIFVNSPGDLTRPEAVPEIMHVLNRFETANNSVGSASTHMWLVPYLPYIGLQNRGSIAFKYRYLPEFFRNQEYRRWSHFVSMGSSQECMDEKPSCLRKFVFSTGFHNAVSEQGDAQSSPGFDELRKMKNKFLEEVTTFPKQVAWSERLRLLESWRRMAAEYTHLNLTVYEDFSMYSDQLLTIVPVTQQTVFFALICMIFILMLFTPSFYTICTSTAAVLSINIGVFGCLVYMHIDLDPISMTTTLMAIGFSVDFVAHITFHYYKGEYPSKRDRLRHALSSIAWPMIQAGTSTMAGIAVLIVIHAYMVQVFVKVVVLVISLGMVHGLLILPVVFAALPFKKMSTEEVAVAKNQEQSAIQSRTEVAIPLKGAEKNRKSAKA